MLIKAFRHKRIPVSGILKDKSRTTVTKTRILAGMTHSARQQVVRVDREPESALNSHFVREIVLSAREYARASDAVLVSDYGYGSATPAILNAVRAKGGLHGVPVTLDSRFRMLEYSGVTAATPNEPEVEASLGIQIGQDWRKLVEAGEQLMTRMKLQSLIVTRGRDGMAAFAGRHKPVDIPIFGSDEVADVTGAGDTVIAAFTAALAAGASTEEAAQLANYAGGIVVMKRGTATVSRQELLLAIDQSPRPPDPIERIDEIQGPRPRATAPACGVCGVLPVSGSYWPTDASTCCMWATCDTFTLQKSLVGVWWSPSIPMIRCGR